MAEPRVTTSEYGDARSEVSYSVRRAGRGNGSSIRETQLPPLHLHAYRGNLEGVLMCITEGHDVRQAVTMRNKYNQLVGGITPLFLAAQKGHMKVVKLLVENGANPNQPSFMHGRVDLCTPSEVARLNFHFLVAHYLNRATARRKEEDRILREEEEEAARQRNPGLASTSMGVSARVNSGTTHYSVATGGIPGSPTTAMAAIGDLSMWDPTTGAQPRHMNAKAVAKVVKKSKVDLQNWRPDTEVGPDGRPQMATSISRPVDPSELENVLEVEDHGRILKNFLKDADLADWDPEGEPIVSVSRTAQRRVSGSGAAMRSRPGSRSASPTRAAPAQRGGASRSPSPYTGARPAGGSVSSADGIGPAAVIRDSAPRAAARAAAVAAATRSPPQPPVHAAHENGNVGADSAAAVKAELLQQQQPAQLVEVFYDAHDPAERKSRPSGAAMAAMAGAAPAAHVWTMHNDSDDEGLDDAEVMAAE